MGEPAWRPRLDAAIARAAAIVIIHRGRLGPQIAEGFALGVRIFHDREYALVDRPREVVFIAVEDIIDVQHPARPRRGSDESLRDRST